MSRHVWLHIWPKIDSQIQNLKKMSVKEIQKISKKLNMYTKLYEACTYSFTYGKIDLQI